MEWKISLSIARSISNRVLRHDSDWTMSYLHLGDATNTQKTPDPKMTLTSAGEEIDSFLSKYNEICHGVRNKPYHVATYM